MDKKLPKVFVNNIGNIRNNNEVFYSKKKQQTNSIKRQNNQNDINKKINQIFSSSNYVYKANVLITTVNGTFNKKIIGRNKSQIITLDNEIINISDILDIKF